MPIKQPKVLIVSPYASVRAGLYSLLDDAGGNVLVGEVSGSLELVDVIADLAPDVVIVDDTADERSLIAQVLAETDARPVLLADMGGTELNSMTRYQGAFGLLPKDADGPEIASAVAAVAAGLTVLHSNFAAAILRQPGVVFATPTERPQTHDHHDSLTPRERQVLQLIAGGLPNKQIASRLGVSPHTVKFHVASLLAKLGAASRAEAVTLGARQGYVML